MLVRGMGRGSMRSSMGSLPSRRCCRGRISTIFGFGSRCIRRGFTPRNELEEDLARKAALASWQHDRAVAAEKSRAEAELEALEKAATAERLEALKLGSRLLFDRRGATAMYGLREYSSKQPKTSYSGDSCDPDQPERLVLQLEQTVAGCRWLLEQWIEIRTILERGLGWQSREKLVVTRLLGMQPIDVAHKPDLAKIFIACHLIEPQYKSAFREMRCELDDPAYRHYNRCLTRRQVEALKPADESEARAYLLTVVDKATRRLRTLEAVLEKKAEEDRVREGNLINHGVSKTGEQIRRAQGAFNRLLIQNVNAVRRVQREDDRGWELVRKLREERKVRLDEKRTSPSGEGSWIPTARFTMPRATKATSKRGWSGLNASLARRRMRLPSSETCSRQCLITPVGANPPTNRSRRAVAEKTAGVIRASPSSRGIVRRASSEGDGAPRTGGG